MRLLGVLLTLFALNAPLAAQESFPALTGRVVDQAGMLDTQVEVQLTRMLAGHEQATGEQVVVVTIPGLVGDEHSAQFPPELLEFRQRRGSGMKVNLLINYGWEWDLDGLKNGGLRSSDVSRLDLIVRWGGGRRLSGFLPVQSVYADFYVCDQYWPDFDPRTFRSSA